MTQYIEDFLPPVQSSGLNTLENTSLAGTLAVTGTSTFTGQATFATAPTFTGGMLKNVVDATAAATLTVAQSGSIVLLDSATPFQLTLPAPVVGTTFQFISKLKPSSGSVGFKTSSNSVFLVGAVQVTPITSSATLGSFTSDSVVATAVGMNGTTTGGSVGTFINVACISTTQWAVSGVLLGSGVVATPFLP